MAVVVPNQAELNILKAAVGVSSPSLQLRLFKNGMALGADTTLADFQEATFDGYAPAVGFTNPTTGADGKAKTERLNATWTKAAGANNNTIYGWYVVMFGQGEAAEMLFACALFAAPRPMDAVGNTITTSVTLTLREDS